MGKKDIKNLIDATFKESMREMILSDGVRSDGRKLLTLEILP